MFKLILSECRHDSCLSRADLSTFLDVVCLLHQPTPFAGGHRESMTFLAASHGQVVSCWWRD